MITNKNIDEVLKKEYFSEIKEFFKRNSSAADRVKFLKKTYGVGGWYSPKRGDFIDGIVYDESGIEFRKTKPNWQERATANDFL